MQVSGSNDLEYCRAWAKMMVTIWTDKIVGMNIRDTGALLMSFTDEVLSKSAGNTDKIIFSYLYYGRMVAMDVRKGHTLSDRRLEGSKPRKDWYTKAFYHSIHVLTEKRAELYGQEFQSLIMDTLNF